MQGIRIYKAAAKTLLTEAEQHLSLFHDDEAVKVSLLDSEVIEVCTHMTKHIYQRHMYLIGAIALKHDKYQSNFYTLYLTHRPCLFCSIYLQLVCEFNHNANFQGFGSEERRRFDKAVVVYLGSIQEQELQAGDDQFRHCGQLWDTIAEKLAGCSARNPGHTAGSIINFHNILSVID